MWGIRNLPRNLYLPRECPDPPDQLLLPMTMDLLSLKPGLQLLGKDLDQDRAQVLVPPVPIGAFPDLPVQA